MQKSILEFLDEVILELHAGYSFRSSCLRATQRLRGKAGQKMRYIVETVVFSQHSQSPFTDKSLNEFVRVLQSIEEVNHLSLEKVVAYRDKLRMYYDFRRKSGHALLQTRLQAVLITVMYFAVLLYVVFRFGIKSNEIYIAGSLILYLIGSLYLLQLGKSYKWKI